MPIDPTHSSGLSHLKIVNKGAEHTREAAASAPSAKRAAPDASVAAELKGVNTADDSQDINAARVAEIRQGLADGSLQFDTARIADGLIASARELTEE